MLIASPWHLYPADHGGNVRLSRLAEGLSKRFHVRVVQPQPPNQRYRPVLLERIDFELVTSSCPPDPRRSNYLSSNPATTRASWPTAATEIAAQIENFRPELVYWGDSHLASVAMRRRSDMADIVEFANIESQRYRSMTRSEHGKQRIALAVEAAKARLWEPRVMRQATATVALSQPDAAVLASNNDHVVLVPNGYDHVDCYKPSPQNRISAVGSWWYSPNRDGLKHFLATTWPRIRRVSPEVQMDIIGSGSDYFAESTTSADGVNVVGFVDDLNDVYARSTLILAPARTGGGSQLKVAGAHSYGRVVIGPTHLQRESRPGVPRGAITLYHERSANDVVALLRDQERRHAVEAATYRFAQDHSWDLTARTLSEQISNLVLL